MKPKNFGKLIAHLRKEQHDECGQPYTQKRLAQEMGVSPAVISNMERGEKATLESDILPRLADALRMSRRERREFLLAAIRIDEQEIMGGNAQESLEKALDVLKNLALPAFLTDTYDNLLAVNHSILALFEYSDSLIQQANQHFAGYNVLRFVFSQDSPFSESILENKQPYLLQSISFFRAITLPWRATSYYARLMAAFAAAPDMQDFRATLARSANDEGDALFEDKLAVLQHARFGRLKFYSPPLAEIPSPAGNLHLVAYLPADAHTAQVFTGLTQQGDGQVTLLESFPVEGYDEFV